MEETTGTELVEVNETMERRKEQFEMRLRGFKRKDIVDKLSEKYNVVPTTIDQDWARRDGWILDVVGIADLTGLVASTVGSFNLSQSFRQQIFNDLISLTEKYKPDGDLAQANTEELAAIWSMIMRLLNDIDVAEVKKSEVLMKLGILQEAPKKLEVNRKEVKVEHHVNWVDKIGNMSEELRKELFRNIEDIEFEEVDQ